MDATKLIEFLGHSSIYPQFDDLLHVSGVKSRPTGNEGTVWIADKKQGWTLTFQDSSVFDEESIFPKKSEGRFILTEVTLAQGFSGALPWKLSFNLDRPDLENLLGKAREVDRSSETYLANRILITVVRGARKKWEFIRFSVPNIYDKKNLNL